jgi:hypothetical protein
MELGRKREIPRIMRYKNGNVYVWQVHRDTSGKAWCGSKDARIVSKWEEDVTCKKCLKYNTWREGW